MFVEAIAQFNNGEYYTCHDTLEEIWHNAWQSDRAFYQGILQIAVGLYHLHNHNYNGAMILLGEGTSRLPSYTPDYLSIDVQRLLEESLALLRTIQLAHNAHNNYTSLSEQLQRGELSLPKIYQIEQSI
jgi:hypothetical protein